MMMYIIYICILIYITEIQLSTYFSDIIVTSKIYLIGSPSTPKPRETTRSPRSRAALAPDMMVTRCPIL